jgi:hypothetical protein
MERKVASNQPPLPLTDENQRLVNLRLLKAVKSYNPKGIKGLFTALDSSIKKEGEEDILTYEGMRGAVRRDIKNLIDLDGKPEELRQWLKTKKGNQKLQVRITKNQFLLNNILCLLGLQFEDLFDKDKLPGKADETPEANDFSIKDDDAQETRKILQEINSKLDKVVFQQEGAKIRKTYLQRLSDLTFYLFFFRDSFLMKLFEPEKKGFSFDIEQNEEQNEIMRKGKEGTNENIYTYDYFFISTFISRIHKKSRLFKLFNTFQKSANNDFSFGRLLGSLFLMGILIQLLICFIISANRNKKAIFHIVDGTISDFFSKGNYDNNIVLEKLKILHKKTVYIIQHILESEIKPNEYLCVKYEILFIRFFNYTHDLFQNVLPISDMIKNIGKASYNKKEVESKINEMLVPGIYITFGIKSSQLDYLDNYIKEIEDAQLDLENYYVGNMDMAGIQTNGKQITPFVGLPDRSD